MPVCILQRWNIYFILIRYNTPNLRVQFVNKTNVFRNYHRYEDVYYPEDGMDHTEEYIKVCGYCPENYPWLHNPMGE